MKHFRPLLLRKIGVSLPGLRVRRLCLNRHLPEMTAVRAHAHRFAQILLYMGGAGVQRMGERTVRVRTGTVIFLPPGLRHSFQELPGRRPLCQVIDLEWNGARRLKGEAVQLNQLQLSEIRQHLSILGQLDRPGSGSQQLRVCGIVLLILDLLWKALHLLPEATTAKGTEALPIVSRARRILLAEPSRGRTLHELAAQIGYEQTYLNRLLKAATGMTLGQMRAQEQVIAARRLLNEERRISVVSERLGFCDPNYFARWFRLQTGQTPRHYQRHRAKSL